MKRTLFSALPAAFAAVLASAPAVLVASPSGIDARVHHGSGLASKKARTFDAAADAEPPALLGTLVQTHTDERVALDEATPTDERFSALLADRVTGERHAFDPRLLGL